MKKVIRFVLVAALCLCGFAGCGQEEQKETEPQIIKTFELKDEKITAEKVLELNASHSIFRKMQAAFISEPEKLATYATVLYNQALLIEGLPIEDPVAYANAVCELIG